MDEDPVTCARCGRSADAAEVRLHWSLDVPPRPIGSTAAAPTGPVSYVCPECTRLLVRDVEARLDL